MPKRSLILLLLPVVALMLISCQSVEEGSWVTIDNIEHAGSESVYYVLEEKSPFGENEKYEDSEGYRRICLLLEFVPDGSAKAEGEQRFVAMPFDDRLWELCRELVLIDKPSFDIASVPFDFLDRIDP
ncbi:MAG: hypothetical protein H8D69_02710 [Chloroflexi bacterium]|nr:hypothetical protein [Chloroflexota bacterium]